MPHDDVVILLEGGHKTFVTNTTVGEIERAISDARTAEHSFVYIQNVINGGPDACAVDPNKVVGVVARVR
jgi:hypothetical protein